MIRVLILLIGMILSLGCAETNASETAGELVVAVEYGQASELFERESPVLQLTLLSDDDDLFSQIEALKEQSKPELEPLVKQYMYVAEALTQLVSKAPNTQKTQQKKQEFMRSLKLTEQRIDALLDRYSAVLDSLIQGHVVHTLQSPALFSGRLQFSALPAGKYRIYGTLTFATTTLTWFEPLNMQGGGCHRVNLTRENLMDPYWTTLNWWSFMNLDFSQHH